MVLPSGERSGHQPCGVIWRGGREPSAVVAQIMSEPPTPPGLIVNRMSPRTADPVGAAEADAVGADAVGDAATTDGVAASGAADAGLADDAPPGDVADPQPVNATLVAAIVIRMPAMLPLDRRSIISIPSPPFAPRPTRVRAPAHP